MSILIILIILVILVVLVVMSILVVLSILVILVVLSILSILSLSVLGWFCRHAFLALRLIFFKPNFSTSFCSRTKRSAFDSTSSFV